MNHFVEACPRAVCRQPMLWRCVATAARCVWEGGGAVVWVRVECVSDCPQLQPLPPVAFPPPLVQDGGAAWPRTLSTCAGGYFQRGGGMGNDCMAVCVGSGHGLYMGLQWNGLGFEGGMGFPRAPGC